MTKYEKDSVVASH